MCVCCAFHRAQIRQQEHELRQNEPMHAALATSAAAATTTPASCTAHASAPSTHINPSNDAHAKRASMPQRGTASATSSSTHAPVSSRASLPPGGIAPLAEIERMKRDAELKAHQLASKLQQQQKKSRFH